MKRYKIIYADPPWPFKVRSKTNFVSGYAGAAPSHAQRPYPIMEIKELMAMPIESLASEDCALFMWVVAMYIPDALAIAKAWGFKYKTVAFVWEKNINGKPKPNPGMYTMQSTEFCFLFTKGAMTKYFKSRKVKQLIQAEKRGHSVKPDETANRQTRRNTMARLNFVKKAQKNIYTHGKVMKHTIAVGKNKGKSVEKLIRTEPADSKDTILIKKGEGYYWWKFRFGGIHISKDRPRRSQLTQSDFLGQVYDLEDEMSEATEIDESTISDWVSTVESIRDECQEKLDNMPEQLQENSSSGQLLHERVDMLEDWVASLEQIDVEIDKASIKSDAEADLNEGDDLDDLIEEKTQERFDEIKGKVESSSPGF